MRRTPAATPLSDTMRKLPAWPVWLRWVPPHSSTDSVWASSPMLTTRTVSPYFSLNRAMAPLATASSCFISLVQTG